MIQGVAPEDYMRNFDPETYTVNFRDERYDLLPLIAEVGRIKLRINGQNVEDQQ